MLQSMWWRHYRVLSRRTRSWMLYARSMPNWPKNIVVCRTHWNRPSERFQWYESMLMFYNISMCILFCMSITGSQCCVSSVTYTSGCVISYCSGPGHDVNLNCIHIFIVTGSFLYWCVLRPASQHFFIHSCIYLQILIICYLATFLGTNSLSMLMCRKAINQSISYCPSYWYANAIICLFLISYIPILFFNAATNLIV